MLGVVADLFTLCATTLFPLFAAYKALKDASPGTLAPWLIFYATLSVIHFLEGTVLYPLAWLPFYSWVRLFGHVYLLMPAPQGATQLYNSYIEPYLRRYETDIEHFISSSHDQLKSIGLQYLTEALDWARINILGQQPRPTPTPPNTTTSQTYAQHLLSRFYNPSAAAPSSSSALTGSNLYNAVFSAVQAASLGVGSAKPASRSVNLVPSELNSPDERLKYVQQAREGLVALIRAYDKEEMDLVQAKVSTRLVQSRSEAEFDKIERSEISPERGGKKKPTINRSQSSTSSWMPWSWKAEVKDAATAIAAAAKKDLFEPASQDIAAEGRSSGNDLHSHQ